VEWAAWVAWVEWVEWACNPKNLSKEFRNAREINLSGVFFCEKIQRRFQRRFNEGKTWLSYSYLFKLDKRIPNNFKVVK